MTICQSVKLINQFLRIPFFMGLPMRHGKERRELDSEKCGMT